MPASTREFDVLVVGAGLSGGLPRMGAGYNAACVVAEDLGVRDQRWWP